MHAEILGAIFLGWALGANDAANAFGTAVASRMIQYRTAIVLLAIFVLVGAILEGGPGIAKIGSLTQQDKLGAALTSITTALAVTAMITLRLPVSTTQALAGSAIGMGLYLDPTTIRWSEFLNMIICWIGTPIGGALIAALLYPLLGKLLDFMRLNLVNRSIVLKIGLILSGSYSAFALGANNVGNVTGVYYGTGIFDNDLLALAAIGGASIALGGMTFSKRIMLTVGSRLVELDAFSALIAVLASGITVHAYAVLTTPVSMSQALVGSVIGIGIVKGLNTINRHLLINILVAWFFTPIICGMGAFLIATLLH